MAGTKNDVIVAKNGDFSQAGGPNAQSSEANGLALNGQLWVGSTALNAGGTHVNVGSITSSTLTVGYSSPNITVEAGATVATTYTTDSGNATPAGNIIFLSGGTNGIDTTGAGNVVTFNFDVTEQPTIPTSIGTDSGTATPALNTFSIVGGPGATVSGSGSTVTVSVTPSEVMKVGAINIGFDLTAGVFSITGGDGTALSASNPGYITIWRREATDPGELVTITLTANQSFSDSTSGGSTIDGNLFGLTDAVNYGNNLPFFVYAVLNDAETTVQFMISRSNFALTSPIAADIGMPSTTAADKQNDFFSFANITAADFEGNPALPIGTIYMQKVGGAANDWTVQGLFASGSGLNWPGEFYGLNFGENFIVPTGQFGAATGTFMNANGGTAPVFTTNSMVFSFSGPNNVRLTFYMDADGGTDGAGAVSAQIAIPYTGLVDTTPNSTIVGSGYLTCPAYTGVVIMELLGNTRYLTLRDATGTLIANQDFSNGARTLKGQVIFRTGANP